MRAGSDELGVLAFNNLKSSNPAAYIHTYALSYVRGDGKSCLTHGEISRSDGKLNESARLLDVFAINKVFGSEAFDLAGYPCAEVTRVKKGDSAYTGPPLSDTSPSWLSTDAHRTKEANSGDDYTTFAMHHDWVRVPFLAIAGYNHGSTRFILDSLGQVSTIWMRTGTFI